MIFLTIENFEPYIRRDLPLAEVVQGDESLLDEVELKNIDLISQYTGRHFNSTCLFPVIQDYATSSQYNLGDYVNDNGIIYTVSATATPPHVITDTSLFTPEDPRSFYVIGLLIDLILWDIHARISPNQIPQLRQDRFETAMVLLKDIADGMISGLPASCLIRNEDKDGDGVPDYRHGSNTKQNWFGY